MQKYSTFKKTFTKTIDTVNILMFKYIWKIETCKMHNGSKSPLFGRNINVGHNWKTHM